jgi:hypothetical protein
MYADCVELKKLLITILKSSKGVKSEEWKVGHFDLTLPSSFFPLPS